MHSCTARGSCLPLVRDEAVGCTGCTGCSQLPATPVLALATDLNGLGPWASLSCGFAFSPQKRSKRDESN